MPSKLCNGQALQTPYLRQSNAYCEGREAATAGAAKTTNPHPDAIEDHVDWDNGWDSYNGGTGTAFQDCCASPGYS